MTEDRLSFSLKGEKCDSADTLDYPAGQAHITVISGRFRIDGRDQELERGTSTVDDKNIHSLEAFPVVVPSLIAKASQLLPFKNHGFLFGQINFPNHARLSIHLASSSTGETVKARPTMIIQSTSGRLKVPKGTRRKGR